MQILTNTGEQLATSSSVHTIDLWRGKFRSFATENLRVADCPCCQQGKRDFLYSDKFTVEPQILCGRNAVQLSAYVNARLDLNSFAQRWQGLGEVKQSRFLVRLQFAQDKSITLFIDGRAVIEGTENPTEARATYARFVGN
jgi:adenylyltransferase/sulfurtransferase